MRISGWRLGPCLAGLLIIASPASRLEAQTALAVDAFEVVSIKPRSGDRALPVPAPPDRFIRPDATLFDLIRYAYDVQEFQIEGGAGWMRSDRFEVNARAASPPAGPDGMRALVRRLLVDRFKLRTRIESRDLPRYDLVVARRDGRLGEKLRRSTFDCDAVMASGTAADVARCDLRFRPKMGQASNGRPTIYSMTLMLQGVRLGRLATLLQNSVERTVIDKTGLDGTFDLDLEFAPDGTRRPAGLPGPPSPPSDGPPLMTALQEQLGLKLEAGRGPVPVVIIEAAQLPTPD